MQLGERLQQIRKEHDLTQEEMAAMLHVTRQTVSNWELEKSYPDLESLIMISDHFDVSVDTMLKEDAKMTGKMNRSIRWAKMVPLIMGVCVWEFLALEVFMVNPKFHILFWAATAISVISCICSVIVLKIEKSVITVVSALFCFIGMIHFLLIIAVGLLMFTY